MNFKNILSLTLCFLIIFTLSSCKAKEDTSVTQLSTTEFNDAVTENVAENIYDTEFAILNTTSETSVQDSGSTSSEASVSSTEYVTETTTKETADSTTEAYDDPTKWSKTRIVEEYKKAAKKSNSSAKSTQKITLKEIHINNGEYDSAISLVKPIIAKFIDSKSTEIDGITGGFENLSPRDIDSAKAYESSDGIVIEMTMLEQTAGAKDDALSGSVGHAITAVGDISEVTGDLEDMGLPLEISEKDTKIYYTNPTLKVVIDDNGEIISGTWNYTVKISMNNLKAFGKTVDNATIVMDNIITI